MNTSGAPERALRVAVIGCADIAWRRTIPAMQAVCGIRVVAVASRSIERARRFADQFGAEAVVGYRAALDRDDIDAVYIPLPALLHADWIEQSLLAGKHVLVEKPMTDHPANTERLLSLARERDLVLLENFMFLFHSQHARVQKLLADGVIGELRGFSAAFTIPPKPPGDIRYRRDVGGGAFLDFGGYPVRAASHFLGDRLDVSGAVFAQDLETGVVVSGTVLLTTPTAVTAELTFGMRHAYRNEYRLWGSEGLLELDRVFTPPESMPPVLRVERQDHREQFVLPADHQFANVVECFLRAVRGEDTIAAHQEGTLRQARLMEQIDRAARRVPV